MLKIICLILLMLFTGLSGFGQKIVNALSFERKEPRPMWYEYCKSDGGFVILQSAEKNNENIVNIVKYNANFIRQWYKTIYDDTKNKYKIEQLTVLGTKAYVFVSSAESSSQKTLSYYSFDIKTGSPEVQNATFHTGFDDNENMMIYSLSLNKKRLLLFERVYAAKKPTSEVKMYQFTSESNEIVKSVLKLSFPSDQMIFKSVKVTNEGDVALLTRIGKETRNPEKNQIRYELTRYNMPDFEAQNYTVQYPDVYVTDLNLKPDRDGNLLLGGFYSNRNINLAGGLLFLKMDKSTHEPIVQNKAPFSKEFLSGYLTPRQLERGRELNDFYLDDLILRSDGGMLFIAEQYYISSTAYRDVYGFWYNRDVYNYDDMVVFSVSAEGEIEWFRQITKNQSSEAPTEISYMSMVGDEFLYLLYKTSIKGMGNNVYVSRIEYDGTITPPKPFFDKISTNDIFYRNFSEQISANEAIMVFYTSKTKVFSLAKIVF